MRFAIFLVLGCTAHSATSGTGAESAAGAEAEAETDADADADADVEPLGECHVSCCSEEMLDTQRRVAAESGDPTIEHECCFCEPEARRESPECVASRDAITAAVATSQTRACADDSECAAVTNPGHPDPEYHLVVHHGDAARIRRDAEAHLERCGAFFHHEALDAFRVVEARCVAGRCGAEETTFHIDE